MADRHADHDQLLVAALAAGDVEAGDLERARVLIASCAECRSLESDLRSIARATADAPTPPRPRDFFLSPKDAERLRPSGLGRLAAALARPRIHSARPLAGGLIMLGFAGLLVASLPGMSQQAALPASDQRLGALASPVPGSDVAGGLQQPAGPSAQPYASGSEFTEAQGGVAQGSGTPIEPDTLKSGREAAPGPSALFVGSVAVLALGTALFVASLVRAGPRIS